MSRIVKISGRTASSQRTRAMHGSTAEWRLWRSHGKLVRMQEKPGIFGRNNRPRGKK